MKLAICSYLEDGRQSIAAACEKKGVSYEHINLLSDDWLEQFNNGVFDGVVIRPPCTLDAHKQIFDERAYVLNKKLDLPIYPNFEELYVYENKRNMHTWCKLHNLPHPKTTVLTTKDEAISFFNECSYPIVTKSNVGASGISVKILKKPSAGMNMAKKIFGGIDPELAVGYYPFGRKKGIPYPRLGRRQLHYMICQEYLNIKWEWRVIRLHDSYFGHKKLIGKNNMASGSMLVGWEAPPVKLLEMVKRFSEEANFTTVALDIFETQEGEFFVNEIQPIIGAIAPSQMYLDDKPGRFLFSNGAFVFDEGEYCKNQCWDLRLEAFIEQINSGENT
jgi:glutathione synthase/RimK-type ligase-like ATP-grasp enzyme